MTSKKLGVFETYNRHIRIYYLNIKDLGKKFYFNNTVCIDLDAICDKFI